VTLAQAEADLNVIAQELEKAYPQANARVKVQVVGQREGRVNNAFPVLQLSSLMALATTGLYGVMSYAVSRRTKEVGIRMALGAQRRDVLRLIVRQGMLLVVIGLLCGLVAALALGRVLVSLLLGVGGADPLTFAGAMMLLVLTALVACWIPARLAARVDPMIALRYE
jgi:putative ABC transport system permease protein